MNMIEAVRSVLGKYATFSGRARRAEYWWWTLAYILASIVLSIIDAMIVGASGGGGILSVIFGLAVLVPSIAVATRRLHDIDRSGWWQLIVLVPLIGAIVLIVWYCKTGTAGPNRFGEDPLA
jgi:uncharacterized membrane protein YhaH (DUF805 family)